MQALITGMTGITGGLVILNKYRGLGVYMAAFY